MLSAPAPGGYQLVRVDASCNRSDRDAVRRRYPRPVSRLGPLAWRLLQPELRNSRWQVRIRFRHARVGKRPYVRGNPLITCRDLVIGDDLLVFSQGSRVRLDGPGRIELGDRVFLNAGCLIMARRRVTIGDDVAVALDAVITDSDHHGLEGRPPRTDPVVIGAGAWIGTRAMVLRGVTVGRRAVVAAGAIVTRDVPDDCLVAGQPARVVRKLEYPAGVRRAWTD